MCKGWFHHPNTHWLTVHLWQNVAGQRGGDRPAGGNRSGSVWAWPGRSVLFVAPLEERTYSPPASGRWYCLRQSCALRGAARRASLPCPVWTGQQTPPAACASSGAAPMHWGLGGHQPPTSCAGYIPGHCLLLLSTPIMRVESRLRWWYTLLVLIQQIRTRPYKAKGT